MPRFLRRKVGQREVYANDNRATDTPEEGAALMLTSFTIYLNLLIEGKKSSVLVLVFLVVVLLVVLLAQLRVLSLGVF